MRDGVPADRRSTLLRVDMRYAGQSHELAIPLGGTDAASWAALAADFHAEHRRRFGHADPEAPLEAVSFGVTATGRIDLPTLPQPGAGTGTPLRDAQQGGRAVFFEESSGGGWHDTAIWPREHLLANNVIEGTAVVEELSATTVLYPGDRARVGAVGSLIVEVGS